MTQNKQDTLGSLPCIFIWMQLLIYAIIPTVVLFQTPPLKFGYQWKNYIQYFHMHAMIDLRADPNAGFISIISANIIYIQSIMRMVWWVAVIHSAVSIWAQVD